MCIGCPSMVTLSEGKGGVETFLSGFSPTSLIIFVRVLDKFEMLARKFKAETNVMETLFLGSNSSEPLFGKGINRSCVCHFLHTFSVLLQSSCTAS